MREAGVVGVEQVREQYREKYEKFLETRKSNIPRINQLEEQGKRDEAERLKTKISASRVVVSYRNRSTLCMICGSYAIWNLDGEIENEELKNEDPACWVCGNKRTASETNES